MSQSAPRDGRWERLKELVAEALERPPTERETFLAEACGDDHELFEQARRLIVRDQAATNPFDRSAAPLPAAEIPLAAGTVVGAYRIVEPLGQGGMGEVYRAERADGSFESQVAIKILRARGLATDFRARFLAERQLLADLDHPDIARLLDGGTLDDGRPYLVMELVEGEPLDVYPRRHGLSTEEILRLMLRICEAVGHAHRLLIVHRDLKPGNILVTPAGEPKLLDFGVSKHLGDLGRTPQTRLAAPMTTEYASPEQLLGGTVSTAVDVYALGVILFELLVGEHPFRGAGDRLEERSHPSRPSLRVARASYLETRQRRLLRRRLAGDLDAIVLHALAPERENRYPSVEALARDIDRHLRGLPLESRGGFWYRLGKASRRHRKAIAAVGVVLALVVALGVSSWKRATLERENQRIEQEKLRVEHLSNAVGGFLGDLFQGADPRTQGARNEALEAFLDRGAELLEQGALENEPETRSYVQASIGQVYRQVGRLDEAEKLLRAALELRQEVLPPDDPRIGLSLNALANFQRARGRPVEALDLVDEGLGLWRSAHPGDDRDTAAMLSSRGGIEKELGRFDQAIAHFTESLEMKRRLGYDFVALASALKNLATAELAAGRLDAAEATLEAVRLALAAEESPPKGVEAGRLHYLGILRREQGQLDAARTLLHQSLALRGNYRETYHRQTLDTRLELARLEALAGDLVSAEEWLHPVLDDLRQHGSNPITLAEALLLAARVESQRGRSEVAHEHLEEARGLARPLLPPAHPLLVGIEGELVWQGP